MKSSSNPNLNRTSSSFKTALKAVGKIGQQQKNVDEKGDAATIFPQGNFEIERKVSLHFPSNLRRQHSSPTVSKHTVTSASCKASNFFRKESDKLRATSAVPSTVKNDFTTTVAVLSKRSLSSDSNLSATTVTPTMEPICEALQKDLKLKALCASLGINQSANTLVGPIEKGQLIIGTLQDSLYELMKIKIKKAERNGEKFHIQQSGLDVAVRALRNAERSLKTIKDSKQPILGRARDQQSSESLLRCHKKTTDAVIRILNTTKEKFDKMGNEMYKFLGGVNLVSALSSSLSPPSSMGLSGYTSSRRTTGASIITTPVTPYYTTTATCSRARTAASLMSIGGGSSRCGTQGKSIAAM